jgi:hypothetical protein
MSKKKKERKEKKKDAHIDLWAINCLKGTPCHSKKAILSLL